MRLVLLQVTLKFPGGVGDIKNIPLCQETGGKFEFGGTSCSHFMVPSGSYVMEAYTFQIPQAGSKVGLTFV